MTNLRRQFQRRLGKKEDKLEPIPGVVGDGLGNVSDADGNIYVRVGDIVQRISQSNVTVLYDQAVWIGYEPTQPGMFKILNVRSVGGSSTTGMSGPAKHASTHEWMGAGASGGSDVLKVQLQQFMPLRVMPYTGFTVLVYPGVVKIGTDFILLADVNIYEKPTPKTIDLEAYELLNADKAKFILITIDTSGELVATEGSEVDLTALALTDIPSVPEDTAYILAALRMYSGMTQFQENRQTTDIIDLRFPMWHTHPAGEVSGISWGDIDLTGSDVADLASRSHTDLTDIGTYTHAEIDDFIDEGGAGIAEIPVQFIEGDVSNPPTEQELIDLIGSPTTDLGKSAYVIDNEGEAQKLYLAVVGGGHWWMTPLARTLIATISVTVESSKVIASESGQWFGRAAVRVINGITILAYYEASHHWANDGALHIRFSDDYGATWSDEDKTLTGSAVAGFPMNPEVSAGEDAGEPWLVVTPNGKLLLHMWRVNYSESSGGTYQSISSDGGLTWSTPAIIDFSGISNDDKIFMTDDHFIFDDVIYAGARVYDDEAGTNSKSILVKSEDNGTTWVYISDISDFATYPTEEVGLEYLGNNIIYAILRDDNNVKTYKRISTDMGATWGSMTNVTSVFAASGRHRIYTRSHLQGCQEWWNDSVLIMVGFVMPTTPNFPRRNCIWVSVDKGETWSYPYYLDTQTEDGGYGDMFYDPINNQYVVMINYGANAECDLKQYNLTIGGI